jgi:large subunit ribosomal protein L22
MEVRAQASTLPIAPQKLRLVCDQVRGKNAEQALVILKYMPQKGSEFIYKVLQSALANAENNYQLNRAEMFIKTIFANEAVRLKRMKAGPRGRYQPRIRRYSHLIVILDEAE